MSIQARSFHLPRLLLISLSLALISCSHGNSNFWSSEQESKPEVQPASVEEKQASSNPFLKGLSEKEIGSIKHEAWREYGRFWRGVANRSRYVRQPLLETLDQAGAPRELQMVPVVESSYNPYVISSVGATGLWQLMPETAGDLKVSSDSNFDGRRDIRASTRAAARYLTQQHRRFGNWPMALAAYHLGPSAVQQRLNRRPWKPGDGLHRMPLPPITKTYIRHIIGLIALHEQGTIHFPAPYPTRTVKLQTPVDLDHLQDLAGLPENQIFHFNPKLKLKQYYDGKPQTLSLRISKTRVARVKQHIPSKPSGHMMIETGGESLTAISKRLKVSIQSLRSDNPGVAMQPAAGTRLRIPVKVLKRIRAERNPLARGERDSKVDVALNQFH
ncbi:membrane-bound lytic murein transglycosylase D [Mariprofundus ferrinatatus]|uniref:Membrane-bound lytic murein transglycosylase D n=1 Tax=Mariprofundus ferrinatatus TaxID=1921087 RepID=A0A2K8L7H9_9PROT|nr:lytic transglycosylase domain-containing protein [Mariprofundus ferrinatatus]ATX82209.1 membrane-bound lytic murein transglycosylase D [Mariprofundus ferrinatatus]